MSIPSEKGSTLKEKNLLPLQKSKQKIIKVVSLVKMVANLP